MEHYRCYQVYVIKTRAKRTAETVEFFLEYTNMPGKSPKEATTNTALDIV